MGDEYERLKAQKDSIIAKEKERLIKWCFDHTAAANADRIAELEAENARLKDTIPFGAQDKHLVRKCIKGHLYTFGDRPENECPFCSRIFALETALGEAEKWFEGHCVCNRHPKPPCSYCEALAAIRKAKGRA
jgi:hypothetical protein